MVEHRIPMDGCATLLPACSWSVGSVVGLFKHWSTLEVITTHNTKPLVIANNGTSPERYRLLTNPLPTPDCARLRIRRQEAGITVTRVARALGTRPARISEIELGRNHNHQLGEDPTQRPVFAVTRWGIH